MSFVNAFSAHRSAAAATRTRRLRAHLPHLSRRAVRTWLNQPGRGPSAAPMYGLLLRPSDRQDLRYRR